MTPLGYPCDTLVAATKQQQESGIGVLFILPAAVGWNRYFASLLSTDLPLFTSNELFLL